MEALGLIENRSYLSAVIAADTALKAADVTLIDVEIIKGGYVTVQLIGDVAAVKAAVEAGTEAVEPFGRLISSHVIPRMHSETHQLIGKNPQHQPMVNDEARGEQTAEHHALPAEAELAVAAAPEKTDEIAAPVPAASVSPENAKPVPQQDEAKQAAFYREDLEKLTVLKLRQLVREKDAAKDKPIDVRYAKKSELIELVLEHDASAAADSES